VFADVSEGMRESAKRVGRYVKEKGKKVDAISKATDKVRNLLVGRRGECREISTQFFVSSVRFLPELVDGIEKGAKKATKGRKQESALYREYSKG